jgi:hypothetical protein
MPNWEGWEDFYIDDNPYDSDKEYEEKIIKLISRAEFFVEATSTEQHFLWAENDREKRLQWEQVRVFYFIKVGRVDGKDVLAEVGMAKLNGHPVCFYYFAGHYWCRDMVEKWLQKRFQPRWDSGSRLAYTDAMNFHHCIHHCEEFKK